MERRQAELEFVSAAFTEEEAWCEQQIGDSSGDYCCPIVVHRQLLLDLTGDNDDDAETSHNENNEETRPRRKTMKAAQVVHVLLSLHMVPGYPESQALQVSIQMGRGQRQEQQQQGNGAIKISASSSSSSLLVKLTYDEALPCLLSRCREMASSMLGSEAVFSVLTAADEWVQDEWPRLVRDHWTKILNNNKNSNTASSVPSASYTFSNEQRRMVLGRRLIYSHHIVSKQKRKDMKELAHYYQLSGYVKIGWPGLIIIEGWEEDCRQFYHDIRQWSWQYLVERGEMQEPIDAVHDCGGNTMDDDDKKKNNPQSSLRSSVLLDSKRRFRQGFREVSEMSTVANACREADLEALFKTSMKVYNDNDGNNNDGDSDDKNGNRTTGTSRPRSHSSTTEYHGALIHVDHMNNGKAYRKWLRKTATELGTLLFIKHVVTSLYSSPPPPQQQQQPHGRPRIVVLLVGRDKKSVSLFLKRWRSSRVDVDSQGRACLERQMQVVIEGPLVEQYHIANQQGNDKDEEETGALWETLLQRVRDDEDKNKNQTGDKGSGIRNGNFNTDHNLVTNPAKLLELVALIGSQSWAEAVEYWLASSLVVSKHSY